MVIILRGVSGSGKTSAVKMLTGTQDLEAYSSNKMIKFLDDFRRIDRSYCVCSADNYFMIDGKYLFDPRFLSDAHSQCLRNFTVAVTERYPSPNDGFCIIVDNTNTTIEEVIPYAALAQAYGHDLSIITIIASPKICAYRNTHGVPEGVVYRQHLNLENSIREWPSRLAMYQQIFLQ